MHPQFEVHMLTDEGKAKARDIAVAFDECLTKLEELCVPSDGSSERAMAIVRTKLEEACFFAKKAMATHHCQR